MEVKVLKKYLGMKEEDTSKDSILSLILLDVEETIINYCNITEIPLGLQNTAYRMAIDLYRNENLGHEESAQGSVSSISIGDTSTTFKQSVDDDFKNTVLKNYTAQLNRYRKMVW